MNYYAISLDPEPKAIGQTGGLSQLDGSPNMRELNTWYTDIHYVNGPFVNWWEKRVKHADYAQQPLKGLLLHKRGKLTDFIEYDSHGFYVSEKLKALLEQGHLPNHKFLPTPITSLKTNTLIEGYYWFAYDYGTGEHTVNFAKSEFILKQYPDPSREIRVKSYQEYMNFFLEAKRAPNSSKIVFNKHFDKNIDVLSMQFLLTPNLYISERLLNKWEDSGITGYIARSPEMVQQRAQRFNDIYTKMEFE